MPAGTWHALLSWSCPSTKDALIVLQVCGGYADALARCAQLLEEHAAVDFVDVNMGCPIDLICNKRGPLLTSSSAALCLLQPA